mmetsp:Transcript_33625/g.49220  ORF Transcript_33625/g.49220 Transcript_33625/m.49220 type:complete len:219 (+) Transcript_33625:287-943(+)
MTCLPCLPCGSDKRWLFAAFAVEGALANGSSLSARSASCASMLVLADCETRLAPRLSLRARIIRSCKLTAPSALEALSRESSALDDSNTSALEPPIERRQERTWSCACCCSALSMACSAARAVSAPPVISCAPDSLRAGDDSALWRWEARNGSDARTKTGTSWACVLWCTSSCVFSASCVFSCPHNMCESPPWSQRGDVVHDVIVRKCSPRVSGSPAA